MFCKKRRLKRVVITALLSLCLMGCASTVEAVGRIDINGVDDQVSLQSVDSSDVSYSYGTWKGPTDAENYLSASLDGEPDKWTEAKISFIPLSDGRISLLLMGPYARSGGKNTIRPLGVYYDDIRVNGALLSNGDFELGSDGWLLLNDPDKISGIPARVVEEEDGNHCMQVWHNAPAIKGLDVQKGKQVDITFRFKPVGEMSVSANGNTFYPISLAKWANMGFADKIEGDHSGGWTDQGSRNDLREFKPGQRRLGHIPFDITDPARNGGKSCLIFKSDHSPQGLDSVQIPIGKTCNTIAFLNACAWGGPKGESVTEATVTYTNGTTETFPFRFGVNTGDWWVTTVPEADIPWKEGGGEGGEIGLYLTQWTLSGTGEVASLEIKPVGGKTLFALVGLTVGEVHSDPNMPLLGESFGFEIKNAAEYTAINLDTLRLEMREAGGDPDAFFDCSKYLSKLSVAKPDGEKAVSALVVFQRSLPPLLLIKTKEITGRYAVTIEEQDQPGNLVSPREGLRRVLGSGGLSYQIRVLAEDGILLSAADLLTSTDVYVESVEDSFFLNAVRFKENAHIDYEISLDEPMAARLLAYSREPENYKNYFWVEVLDQRIKVGGNYNDPSTFFWQGGTVVNIPAGTHRLRISPCKPAVKDRKDLALAYFHLSANRLSPTSRG